MAATQPIPSTMRAWQWSSINTTLEASLTLNPSAAAPPPPKDASKSITVQVVVAAINPVDYKLPEAPLIGRLAFRKPATPGLDFAGLVRLPPGTTSRTFKDGDRVAGKLAPGVSAGSLGEYVVAAPESLVRLADNVTFTDGACLALAGQTAYQTVAPFVRAGDKVFVNGASGGVGTYTVQIAKILGCHVTAACSGANAQLVRDLGADEVVDYRAVDVKAALAEKGKVFDLIVDNAGADPGLHKACDHFAKDGARMVQVGGGFTLSVIKQVLLSSFWPAALGGARTKWSFIGVVDKQEDKAQLAAWVAEGKLKTVVDTTFSFDEAPKAFERLRTGRARGKIVVSSE